MITELFGIELPIVQAPMAGVQGSALAIAVSNAGGLGSLPAAMLSADALRSEIENIRAHTDRDTISAAPARAPFNEDHALRARSRGVDAIVAQGVEAGGHRGMFLTTDVTTQTGTFALLPQILEAVRVPVIAAGGIADARAVANAIELGAAGVQIGTAYLLCPECTTSAVHRAALESDAARHTAITNVITGRPARGIVNRVMRELGPLRADVPPFPRAASAMAPLRAAAEARGSGDFSPLWAGQNASQCRTVSASELTRELVGLTGK